MKAYGRHIMIDCEGAAGEPPVSVEGMCVFIAVKMAPAGAPIGYIEKMARRIQASIGMYEKGKR